MASDDLKIGKFEATSVSEAVTHLARYKLLADLKKWEAAEKLARFRVSMGEHALLWDSTLSEAEKGSFDTYEVAFTKYFIKSTNSLVAEQELLNFKLENFKSVPELWAAILAKGSECGKTGEALCTPFLTALPEPHRLYCLGTDTPTLTNFLNRAKLFAATHKTTPANPQGVHATNDSPNEQINALTNEVKHLKLKMEQNGQGRGRQPFQNGQYGRQQNFGRPRQNSRQNYGSQPGRQNRSNSRNRFRSPSPDRNRNRYGRQNSRRSPSPNRRPVPQCWICSKWGHRSFECWHKNSN